MKSFQQMIGDRVARARKESGLTQEQLSEHLGFKDRQIISYIESGKRKVSSQELLALMQILGKTLDFFTDPTLIVGENVISWRAKEHSSTIDSFETWALQLVGAHRYLVRQLKEPVSPLRLFLPLKSNSTFEQATAAAEDLLHVWQITTAPAPQLQPKIESELHVLVVPINAPDYISGGAVNLPDGATIFLNRHHSRGRRHFTLAHELFHILTWETMMPERFDLESTEKRSRAEKLADNFAAALLMPSYLLSQQLEEWQRTTQRPQAVSAAEVPPKSWFKKVAEFFEVSVDALKFRLINAKLLLADVLLSADLSIQENSAPSPLFGRTLLERLNRGIERGLISARKAASLLESSLDDLAELMRFNRLEPSFTL